MWRDLTLADVCSGIYDGPHATPRKTTHGPIFLGISSLDNGRLQLDESEHLSEEDFKKWTRRVAPQPNDVATLARYHKRIIDAAAVVKAIVEMKKEWDADERRAKELGLSDEELAFYDSVAARCKDVYDEPFLRDLVHDIVVTLKANLKVDWTEPHRENVKAAVRSAVRRVLRKRGVKEQDFDALLGEVMKQAEALYAEWPLAA